MILRQLFGSCETKDARWIWYAFKIEASIPSDTRTRFSTSRFSLFALCRGFHPAVVNGYVNRKALQDWLRNAFRRVFNNFNQIQFLIEGERYTLTYTLQGFGCAHTVEVKSSSKFISFDFVPVFEFTYRQWPLPDPHSVRSNLYGVCSPLGAWNDERELQYEEHPTLDEGVAG